MNCWQRVPTPPPPSTYFMKTPLYCLHLSYVMKSWICTWRALIPSCQKNLVVCLQQGFSLLRSNIWSGFLLVSDLISHTNKQTYTAHRGANRLAHPHKYISTPPVMCSLNSYLYYNEGIIHWYQKFTLQSFTMSLLLKNYWLVKVTYLLIRFNKIRFFP